jgi:hypothetical protein
MKEQSYKKIIKRLFYFRTEEKQETGKRGKVQRNTWQKKESKNGKR